ncbi:DNA alkylation repair protein [Candidatus Enterovibrio escicola]|uniref:DNA alkylation repair protein n=1 Tax=Candidatus Enterovibrio escicola TaxID=1927127 RepID=UPI001237EB7E|nr:DNA alkylation repair protein [Candidatus Enterovibrio escacola]
MAEPLKHFYNKELIESLSHQLKSAYTSFDSERFQEEIFSDNWDLKELKARITHITEVMHRFLPNNYAESIEILKQVSTYYTGFYYIFFPEYVARYGLDDFDTSILALEHFTQYSTAEYAVRPFIKKHKERMISQMELWAESKNPHVRRVGSEGCRPRLPWAEALHEFKKNPTPIFKILEKLLNDDSESVRQSVANNLNDISKDHPELLINYTKIWMGKSRNTDIILKHACRTLLKQGNPEILRQYGYAPPNHIRVENITLQEQIKIGEHLNLEFKLTTLEKSLGRLRIEYGIDFLRQNGKSWRKIFKISYSSCPNTITFSKQHSFKVISTRKYYLGLHTIAIIVNGQELASRHFMLL